MAIYHCSVKMVGGGQSGARESASSWCAYVEREREFGNKDGYLDSFVMLPKNAPQEWRDPHALWAAADAAERQADGQTGREFELALPHELTFVEQCVLVETWAQQLVDAGMCVHAAIHSAPDARNVHAHVTATTRPLDNEGRFANKRVTLYPCRNSQGEERLVSASDWKQAKAEGWEKIFVYRNGQELTQSEATAAGLHKTKDRKGKKPLEESRKATDWDEPERITEWRESWAMEVNRALESANVRERVDHRSYAEQGIAKVPQLHMGAQAWSMEQKGEATVKGEKNRSIETLNQKLREGIPQELKQEILEEAYELRENTEFNSAEEVREHVKALLSRIADKVRELASRAQEAARALVERARAMQHREPTRQPETTSQQLHTREEARETTEAYNAWIAALDRYGEAEQRFDRAREALFNDSTDTRQLDADLREYKRAQMNVETQKDIEPSALRFGEHRRWANQMERYEAAFAEASERIERRYGSLKLAERQQYEAGATSRALVNAERDLSLASTELKHAERGFGDAAARNNYTREEVRELASWIGERDALERGSFQNVETAFAEWNEAMRQARGERGYGSLADQLAEAKAAAADARESRQQQRGRSWDYER